MAIPRPRDLTHPKVVETVHAILAEFGLDRIKIWSSLCGQAKRRWSLAFGLWSQLFLELRGAECYSLKVYARHRAPEERNVRASRPSGAR